LLAVRPIAKARVPCKRFGLYEPRVEVPVVWLPKEIWPDRRLNKLAPGAAGDAALRLFCTPPLAQWRHPNHRQLVERARYYLRPAIWRCIATPVGDVQTYTYLPDSAETSGTVLIVHGWTGEASFMAAIAEPLRRTGFRVVLYDLPAHGLSAGCSSNLMDCARATVAVADHFGPIDAVVTHSFGSMIALVAAEGLPPMPHGLDSVKAFALIASPNRLTEITGMFAKHWQLTPAGLRAFEHRLQRIGRRSIHCFKVARLLRATKVPAVLIHARDDAQVPPRRSQEIAAEAPRAELKLFDALGHSNVLFASQIARAVASFIRQTIVQTHVSAG
jgi:pimeloyl-ACP methyl ester carboxylesterase